MQVADVDSVLSGLSALPYDKAATAAAKYDLVCQALGCETLIVPELKVSEGQPAVSYSIVKATMQSPEFVFHRNSVMESAQQLLNHAVGQLVPVMQERLELKPLYSQNQRANMHLAMGVSALHGPHQGAQKSTITIFSLDLSITSAANVFSFTSFIDSNVI